MNYKYSQKSLKVSQSIADIIKDVASKTFRNITGTVEYLITKGYEAIQTELDEALKSEETKLKGGRHE